MDEILKKALLIDYYGMLLTEKQKQMYQMRYEDDMSLAEIAEEFNISRQAASENINTAEKILLDYDDKLHLIDKQEIIDEIIGELNVQIVEVEESNLDSKRLKKIKNKLEKF